MGCRQIFSALVLLGSVGFTAASAAPMHNVILFVPDGLRAASVTPEVAPTLATLAKRGVQFTNSHALFPTFTTANASAFATGHDLGDTGDFSNYVYAGFPVAAAGSSVTPYLEVESALREVNDHFGGNYLNEISVLAAARAQGYATAAIGKVGPVAIQDLTALDGQSTLIVDDATGRTGGIPLAADWVHALHAVNLAVMTPGRGANGVAGTKTANKEQQDYFTNVITKAVLPRFASAGKPFVLVYWSRDPDGTQHFQGDSPDALVPGINGPTSRAAISNADDNLARILATLKSLGLDKTTDVVVAADHGFSTISKQSRTSASATVRYADVPAGEMPPGFLALDLATVLAKDDPTIQLFDPDNRNIPIVSGEHPSKGNGVIGRSAVAAQIVVAANGGSDLVYLPSDRAALLAPQVVELLLAQDYVSGIFVDSRLGSIPGTLPLAAIGLEGASRPPRPSLVVNFSSHGTGCGQPELCAAEIADTTYLQGEGMHGALSRADTWNFMAAEGPDFKHGYFDPMPASNADIGMTLAHLLKLDIPSKGTLKGRILAESLTGGAARPFEPVTLRSTKAGRGFQTILQGQRIGDEIYYDAAGFPGRTVGLTTR